MSRNPSAISFWIKLCSKRLWRKVSKAQTEDQPSITDLRYYRKITSLVPEIALYKKGTGLQVLSIGESRGCTTMKDYYGLLATSEGERDYLRVNLTKKGTHFFRGDDWGYFGSECLSKFAGKDRIRVWCAGCSSGEEAYSTVMSLLDHVPIDAIDVLATDYNDELLVKCDKGEYAMLHLKEIPERYRHHLDIGEKRFSAKPKLRAVVHTRNLNLITDEYPAPFDIIVCRNVIKFFSFDVVEQVKRKLVTSLAPNGYLFVSTDGNHGNRELIGDPQSLGVEQVGGRGIYRKV